jgi:hypothetical protein
MLGRSATPPGPGRDDSSNGVFANTNNTTVLCPFRKFTSGPGITADKINQASVFHTVGRALPNSCSVDVFSSTTTNSTTSNWTAHGSGTTGSLGISIGSPVWPGTHSAFSGYWGFENTWFYPVLTCNLDAGQGFATFTVEEAGTSQGTRIYPGSFCDPVAGSPLANYQDPSTGGPGGFIEAGGGTGMNYSCWTAGLTTQYSIGRSVNMSGFSIASTSGSNTKQAGSYSTAEFQSVIYPSSALPVTSPLQAASNGWLNTGSFWYLFFKQLDTNGDMKIISYRTTGE